MSEKKNLCRQIYENFYTLSLWYTPKVVNQKIVPLADFDILSDAPRKNYSKPHCSTALAHSHIEYL